MIFHVNYSIVVSSPIMPVEPLSALLDIPRGSLVLAERVAEEFEIRTVAKK